MTRSDWRIFAVMNDDWLFLTLNIHMYCLLLKQLLIANTA